MKTLKLKLLEGGGIVTSLLPLLVVIIINWNEYVVAAGGSSWKLTIGGVEKTLVAKVANTTIVFSYEVMAEDTGNINLVTVEFKDVDKAGNEGKFGARYSLSTALREYQLVKAEVEFKCEDNSIVWNAIVGESYSAFTNSIISNCAYSRNENEIVGYGNSNLINDYMVAIGEYQLELKSKDKAGNEGKINITLNGNSPYTIRNMKQASCATRLPTAAQALKRAEQ